MTRGVNKVILLGHLGQDPEQRQGDGWTVTSFSLATSESWKDKQTGEKQERTEWHRVVCYGRLAEIAAQYLTKGSKVYIEGKLKTEQYEKDGEKRYATKIVAQELQMLGGKDDREDRGQNQSQSQYSRGSGGRGQKGADTAKNDYYEQTRGEGRSTARRDEFDDDIPF